MRPALGGSKPVIRFSSVDLPQPEAPSTTRNSPRLTRRSTPCSAWKEPKDLEMPSSEIIVSFAIVSAFVFIATMPAPCFR